MVYNWPISIQDFLFPPRCRLCLAPGDGGLELCRDCIADLPRLPAACTRCGRAVPSPDIPLCGHCLFRPPAYDRCLALYVYEYPVDSLIHRIKFGEDLALARSLGTLLARETEETRRARPDRVIPVPLHRKRLRERGYNQALELARPLVRLGYNLDPGHCRRVRATAAQAEMRASQRRRNMKNAFEVAGPLDGDHIVLIDDVMTTGTTLNELAATLKNAGAGRVDVWVIARTLEHHGSRRGTK